MAKAHDLQGDQDDALLLIHAAMMLRKRCLLKQEEFNGSFSPDCLTGPVPEELRSFMSVILQGPSLLRENTTSNGEIDEQVKGRARIACTISQLLIYNTYSGKHGIPKTTAIRH